MNRTDAKPFQQGVAAGIPIHAFAMDAARNKWLPAILASCCLFGWHAEVAADEFAPSGWNKAEAALLDDMRGGFSTESGLKIAFGIERTVSINGELLSATSFSTGDIAKLVGGQIAANAPAALTELIQNGGGNVYQTSQLAPAAAATFIQNSLNDQTIRSVTVINAVTNSLEFLKSLNAHSTLSEALMQAPAFR